MKRSTADYSPSVWGNYFLTCVPTLKDGESQNYQHLQNMKEKVRSLLQNGLEKPSQKLNLVDNIQRMGVSYHFESEIEEILQEMHKSPPYNDKDVVDIYTAALWFRLLRQQGYNISCDIFEQFREDNGNFKVALSNDVLGMLSLYEAANLRIHGDDILDQALEFTTFHLKSSLSDMSPNFREKVIHALDCPFHKGLRRIEAKYHISMYLKEVLQNDLLLQFAMLDFNVVQAKHQEEISDLTEWWKRLNFVKTVPYARDRLIESYIWSLGVYFEPHHSFGRKMLAKLVALITSIDDSYDAYGTVEELEPFTEAIQRRDISIIDSLPECMKVACQGMLDLFNEMELVTAENGTSFYVQYVVKEVQKVAQAFLVEAKWREKAFIPSYDEYMKNGTIISFPFLGAASIVGLGDIATKEVLDWFSSDKIPKIVKATAINARIIGDSASHKFERQREHIPSAVECFMHQYGISEEETYKILKKEMENCWKDINEECLNPRSVPVPVLGCIINYSRSVEFLYGNFQDRFTNPELTKDHVSDLFVDPIRIEQYE